MEARAPRAWARGQEAATAVEACAPRPEEPHSPRLETAWEQRSEDAAQPELKTVYHTGTPAQCQHLQSTRSRLHYCCTKPAQALQGVTRADTLWGRQSPS